MSRAPRLDQIPDRALHERLEDAKLKRKLTEGTMAGDDAIKASIDTMMRETGETYRSPKERAAYRAGLGTAAGICDSIAKAGGDRTHLQREKAATARQCGDAIWKARELVIVEREVNPETDGLSPLEVKVLGLMPNTFDGLRKVIPDADAGKHGRRIDDALQRLRKLGRIVYARGGKPQWELVAK